MKYSSAPFIATPPGHFAPALPPRRGRRDVAAVPRRDACRDGARRVFVPRAQRQAAPDVRHLQQPRASARPVLSRPARVATTRLRPISSCWRSTATTSRCSAASRIRTWMAGIPSDICFLTAAPHPASSSFRNTISLDQFIAERIGISRASPRSRSPSTARPAAFRGPAPASPSRPKSGPPRFSSSSSCRARPSRSRRRSAARHRPQHPRRGRRPGQGLQRNVGARDREPARSVFHQRPRPRAPPAGVARLGAQTQAGRELRRAGRSRQSGAIHGQGEDHVRPRAARVRDRLHARHHAHAGQRQHAGRHHSRRDHHRRLPQPLPPREIRGQARAAQGHRRMAHEAARTTCSPI